MPLDRNEINNVFFVNGKPPVGTAAPQFKDFDDAQVQEIIRLEQGVNSQTLQDDVNYLARVTGEYLEYHRRQAQAQYESTNNYRSVTTHEQLVKKLDKKSKKSVKKTELKKQQSQQNADDTVERPRSTSLERQQSIHTGIHNEMVHTVSEAKNLVKQQSRRKMTMKRTESRRGLSAGPIVPQRWLISLHENSNIPNMSTVGISTCLGMHVYNPTTGMHSFAHFDTPSSDSVDINLEEVQASFIKDMKDKGLIDSNSEVTFMYQLRHDSNNAELRRATEKALKEQAGIKQIAEHKNDSMVGASVAIQRQDASQPFKVVLIDYDSYKSSKMPNSGEIQDYVTNCSEDCTLYFLNPVQGKLERLQHQAQCTIEDGSVPVPVSANLEIDIEQQDTTATMPTSNTVQSSSTTDALASKASSIFSALSDMSASGQSLTNTGSNESGVLVMADHVAKKSQQQAPDSDVPQQGATEHADVQMQSESSPPQVDSEDNAKKSGMGNK